MRSYPLPFFLLLLTACSSNLTPFGPGNVVELDQDEQRLWQMSRGEMDELSASGLRYRNPAMQEYVESVLETLLGGNEGAYLPLEPRVVIVDVPVVNAACYPSGDIYLHTAILGRMRNEAQLAMILGHELTHATHRHTHRRQSKTYAASGAITYAAVLASIVSGKLGTGIQKVGGVIARAAIEGYGRDLEREADRVGLTLAAQAGYDPAAASQMFDRMRAAAEKPSNSRSALLFYASHPRMTERAENCRRLVRTLSPELRSHAKRVGEQRYVEVFHDLIFDEAEQHVAQGRFDLVADTAAFLRRTRPSDPRTGVLLGDLKRHEGDLVGAREAFEQALQRVPSNAAAHRGLGLVAAKQGDAATAIRHLRRYLALAGDASDRGYIESFVEQLTRVE